MGIHDLMHQMSKQLTEIIKPMVQNETQLAKEHESRVCEMDHFAYLGYVEHHVLAMVAEGTQPTILSIGGAPVY